MYRKVRSGHWLRCSPGVFFVDDRPFTDRARIRAADSGAHSEAERLLVGLLRQARITGWKANQRLGRWEIDVGGLAFHRAVCSSRERSSPTPKPSNEIGSNRTNSR